MKQDKCPICNGKLTEKFGDVIFPISDKKKVTVKKIHFLECEKCEEKIFAHEAQVKIEESVYGKQKGVA